MAGYILLRYLDPAHAIGAHKSLAHDLVPFATRVRDEGLSAIAKYAVGLWSRRIAAMASRDRESMGGRAWRKGRLTALAHVHSGQPEGSLPRWLMSRKRWKF